MIISPARQVATGGLGTGGYPRKKSVEVVESVAFCPTSW